jgi:hypothetical protein
MRGLAGAPVCWSNKKTAPYPTWDKSCTPAIPPKLTSWKTSARFTRHHACPMDNGWVPVGIYLVSRSSRPRKPIRPAAPHPDLTTQDSLQVCSASYYSFSQVSCCSLVGAIITASPPPCQPPFFHLEILCRGRALSRPVSWNIGASGKAGRARARPLQFFHSRQKKVPGPAVRGPWQAHRAEYPYLSTTASSSCFSLHMGHSSGR